jgi:antagonist of KipI
MSVEILKPGFFTTIQDDGRFGYQCYGMPTSGPMDQFAFKSGNRLVGNKKHQASLEIGFGDAVLRFSSDSLIAVTGRGYKVEMDSIEIPLWMSFVIRHGRTLSLKQVGMGGWIYLSVAGGFETSPALSSRSTYLKGKIGGLEGRILAIGDILDIGTHPEISGDMIGNNIKFNDLPKYCDHPNIRVIPGPEISRFNDNGLNIFYNSEYSISLEADRMGYRLQGEKIEQDKGADIISSGLLIGTIQVPPDGQPIVMMPDHPTTGGYPRIAVIISSDLPILAQCIPGFSKVKFFETTIEIAQSCMQKMGHVIADAGKSLEGESHNWGII